MITVAANQNLKPKKFIMNRQPAHLKPAPHKGSHSELLPGFAGLFLTFFIIWLLCYAGGTVLVRLIGH